MATKRNFLGSLALLLFLNLLVKPVWILGIDLTVQNRLGPADYGIYFSLYNFSLLFNVLLDLGLTLTQNRSVARDESRLRDRFLGLSVLKLILGGVYLLISGSALYASGYREEVWMLGIVLAFNQVLGSLILFFRAHLSGLHLYRLDAVVSITDKLLLITLCAFLLFHPAWSGSFNMATYVFAQTVTYALGALIAFALVLTKGKPQWHRLSARFLGSALKESWPYAFLVFLMSVYNRVDGVMVERIAGAVESGIYAAGFRLLDAFNQVAFLFSLILLPMFSRFLDQPAELKPLVKLSTSIMLILTLSVSVFSWFYAEPVIGLLYKHRVAESTEVFRWLMPAALAFGLNYVYGTLLTAGGAMGWLNGIAFLGFGINLLLNALWIPDEGALGAARATLWTQGGTAALQMITAHLRYKIGWEKGELRKLLLALTGLLVAGWLGNSLPLIAPARMGVTLAGFVLSLVLSRLVPLQRITSLLKARLRS